MIIPVDSDSWHIFSKCLKKFKAHHYEFQTPWVLRVNFLQNNLQNYSSLIKHFRKKYLNVATKMASAVENVEPQNFTKPYLSYPSWSKKTFPNLVQQDF
jgi:hypothetical protein